MEKSQGKPVPVKYGSSQEPSACWASVSQVTPRATARLSRRPAASRASSAQAVWEAVDSPCPIHFSSVYERRSSPQPPSSFCTDSSQVTARRIEGCAAGSPAATSAGTTDPVP